MGYRSTGGDGQRGRLRDREVGVRWNSERRRLAVAQVYTWVGDGLGNLERMIPQIEATEREKANLMVVPEMTLASRQKMDGFGLYASSRGKTQRGLWNLEARGQSSFSAALNRRRLNPCGRRSFQGRRVATMVKSGGQTMASSMKGGFGGTTGRSPRIHASAGSWGRQLSPWACGRDRRRPMSGLFLN